MSFQAYSETDRQLISVNEQEPLLQASLKAGIRHVHVCGGNARCSTCRVRITEGLEHCMPRNSAEQKIQQQLDLPDDIRLACQTRIIGDVRVQRLAVDDIDTQIIRSQVDRSDGSAMGHERQVAVMFADLSNYTEFAASMPAYDVVHILNRYYRCMNDIVEAHYGLISDVAGDGMLVLFGACGKDDQQVAHAVACIRSMCGELQQFNQYLQCMHVKPFGLRAGISFGRAIVGDFSTGAMSKVAAIGDVVNVASRIEQANRPLGTQLLLSEEAYAQIEDSVPSKGEHRCHLKGKKEEHLLIELSL